MSGIYCCNGADVAKNEWQCWAACQAVRTNNSNLCGRISTSWKAFSRCYLSITGHWLQYSWSGSAHACDINDIGADPIWAWFAGPLTKLWPHSYIVCLANASSMLRYPHMQYIVSGPDEPDWSSTQPNSATVSSDDDIFEVPRPREPANDRVNEEMTAINHAKTGPKTLTALLQNMPCCYRSNETNFCAK